jgi:hypothetical protein
MGIDRVTGKALYDFQHVEQSFWVCLTTAFASRVMLRTFGSAIPVILGRMNLTESTLLTFWTAVIAAIEPRKNQYGTINGEPRFIIDRILYPLPQNSTQTLRAGNFAFELLGTYYPRALSGDQTSAPVPRPLRVQFPYQGPQ